MLFEPDAWRPAVFARKRQTLETRAKILRLIRNFFDNRGFVETDTPLLQICPGMDVHIHAFETQAMNAALEPLCRLYLHTSPEFAMKKLLAAGMERIYGLQHVFRNGETGMRHRPEFMMLEWYVRDQDYRDVMAQTTALLQYVAAQTGISDFRYKGRQCPCHAEPRIYTLKEAFHQFAALDLDACLDDRHAMADAARQTGLPVRENEAWDDIFLHIVEKRIEPYLGFDAPAFLVDYPAKAAMLSRKKVDDPRYAERFELYICGLELANAYSELTDAAEQRERFTRDYADKMARYGFAYAPDPDFLAALDAGPAQAAGIALGVDRLVMLLTDQDNIANVQWL